MAPVIFYSNVCCLDHQGKCTGPNNDHHRNAHKEIFHASSLRIRKVCIHDQIRTEYREVKLRQIENGNFLPFGHSSISEFVASITLNEG